MTVDYRTWCGFDHDCEIIPDALERRLMASTDSLLPESSISGLIPTMNNMGWMTETLDPYSQAFVEYAASIDGESLDIGCAYGVATLPALAAGARIAGCDIDARHLEILARRVPERDRARFRSQPGAMPDVDFPSGAFGAILCARALHFLKGADIERTVRKMYNWCVPGGRIFLIADSPYVGPWWVRSDEYERRKREGCPWPGFVQDYGTLLPEGVDRSLHPSFIHPLDPDILQRVVKQAGFKVIEAAFLHSAGLRQTARAHAGVIAGKPPLQLD
ncbi:MAG: class I SAM-dependent methyltransferase [Gammaproteobacteria bacterium]